MRWDRWAPIYRSIVSDFGYDEGEDRRAAMILADLEPARGWGDVSSLEDRFGPKAVVIGNAPTLEVELARGIPEGTVVAAGSSIASLIGMGIVPDVHVTDLDGDRRSHIESNSRGCSTLIHAHGDNVRSLRSLVPLFKGIVYATTQAEPFGPVMNLGGFTDGDRAFCTAAEMGAKEIHLIGFDFDEPRCDGNTGKGVKSRKLDWARRIIDAQMRLANVTVYRDGRPQIHIR